jgi:hypothetical protein
MRFWISAVLGVIFFGSLTLLFLVFSGAEQGTVRFEAAKALLQIGVVAVAGAVVSVLIFEYQRERAEKEKEAELQREKVEKRADLEREEKEKLSDLEREEKSKQRELDRKSLEYRETLLLSTLSRAMASYGRTKKARRLLRGRAITKRDEEKIVLASQYDVFFDLINDAQLDFENLARDVMTSAKAFSKATKTADELKKLDSYLNDLIGEYEDCRGLFSGSESSLPLKELPCLQDFLQPAKLSKFKDGVVVPYHEVQFAIRADLMHPNLPSWEKSGS